MTDIATAEPNLCGLPANARRNFTRGTTFLEEVPTHAAGHPIPFVDGKDPELRFCQSLVITVPIGHVPTHEECIEAMPPSYHLICGIKNPNTTAPAVSGGRATFVLNLYTKKDTSPVS